MLSQTGEARQLLFFVLAPYLAYRAVAVTRRAVATFRAAAAPVAELVAVGVGGVARFALKRGRGIVDAELSVVGRCHAARCHSLDHALAALAMDCVQRDT